MSEIAMTYVNSLLSDCQTITESFERVSLVSGENFNLFTILGLETKEVATHSQFIAELLNPKGSHGRGEKFLELFLIEVGIKDFEAKGARVEVEHSFSGVLIDGEFCSGRIDIYIESNNRVIMIENKILAYEQVDQLRKYKAFRKNGELFFLTLLGDKSYQDGHKNLIGGYQRISYRDNIKNWLELCRKEAVESPLLRESITLYLNIVKKLTNQNLNFKMSQSIANLITGNIQNFKAYKALYNSFDTIRLKVQIDFWEKFKKELSFRELHCEAIGNFPNSTGIYSGFKIENKFLKENNLEIRFIFQGNKQMSMIFGLTYLDSMTVNQIILEKFDNEFVSHESSKYFPCFRSYSDYLNWSSFEVLESMQNEEFLKNILERVDTLYKIGISK